MLTIRLQRTGKKNQASFRIILAQKYRAAKKQAVEILGHYNPRSKDFGIKDTERLQYWMGQHVEISPTVYNLFITKGLVTGKKLKSWRPKIKAVPASDAAPATKPAQSPAAATPVGGENKAEPVAATESVSEAPHADSPETPAAAPVGE